MAVQFEITHQNGSARTGILRCAGRPPIQTPVFMPVGTQAVVKTLDHTDLETLGVDILLSNAYHLYLRPGAEVIEAAGGIHAFMHWGRGVITDSGGFQVFSLSDLRRIREDGVWFTSHLDGAKHLFTPENNIELQHRIGADIMMALDVCVGYPASVEEVNRGVDLTSAWVRRGWERHQQLGGRGAFFGIIQGGILPAARQRSVRDLVQLPLDGYAIGGLSVGEGGILMREVLDILEPLLPKEKPRYLMGVGTPEDLWEAFGRGIDMVDCAMPTRIARNGTLYTSHGRINIRNARFTKDLRTVDEECACPLCRDHTRAYLRHLVMAKEITGLRLSTLHNVTFMLNLARSIQEAIKQNRFEETKYRFFSKYSSVK